MYTCICNIHFSPIDRESASLIACGHLGMILCAVYSVCSFCTGGAGESESGYFTVVCFKESVCHSNTIPSISDSSTGIRCCVKSCVCTVPLTCVSVIFRIELCGVVNTFSLSERQHFQ